MYGKILADQAMVSYNATIAILRIVKNLRKEKKAMLFAPKEKGQGLVEYALILVLVAIVVIAVLMLLGPIIGNVFSTINDSLSGATS
jgi:pilus assembly protein Flp/PilA